MRVAAVSVGLAAAAVGIWLANRRAGVLAALATTLGYLLLILLYDPVEVLSPWNPNVAMLWWVTLLLALWGVLCRDYALLPVTAFAAALCAQAHVSYLGLAGGLAIIVAVYVLVDVVRNPPLRRQLLRWGLIAAVVELVLGALDLRAVATGHRQPHDPDRELHRPEGLADPVRRRLAHRPPAARHHDPGRGALRRPGVPAWTLIVLWAASVAAAVWLRRPWLSRLHVVTAAAMATSFLAIVRITGVPWYYLMLWARGTALLVAGTAVTTLAVLEATLWSRRMAAAANEAESGAESGAEATAAAEPLAEDRPAARRRAAALALRVNPRPAPGGRHPGGGRRDGRVGGDRPGGRHRRRRRRRGPRARPVRGDAPPHGLDRRRPRRRGPRDDKTLVTFTDPVMLGSSGFTMMLALERYGFETYTVDNWRPAVGDERAADQEGRPRGARQRRRRRHRAVAAPTTTSARSRCSTPAPTSSGSRCATRRPRSMTSSCAAGSTTWPRSSTRPGWWRTDPDFPADLFGQLGALSALPQPIAVFVTSEPGTGPPAPGSGEPG